MKEARIIHVEDDQETLVSIRRLLTVVDGHIVALEAATIDEAVQLAQSGKLAEVGINVAIVDGFLPQNSSSKDRVFGGPIVAQAIRDASLGIRIISHSNLKKEDCDYGDCHANKLDGIRALREAIASL